MTITPQDFVDRWGRSALREQQGAQSHFNELCQLVGHKTPTQLDPEGTFFTFEENVEKATGGRGRADVWYAGRFAWEYKGKHKDLDAAYAQLLAYRGDLGNPPLLVVCDFDEFRIYPQWVNTSGFPFVFHNNDLLNVETRRWITWLLESPDKFLELRQTELERREQLTLDLARKFAHLADLMRQHKGADGQPLWDTMQIARFLTKLVFCLFAEDVELMPRPFDQPVFRYLTDGARSMPETFVPEMVRLFEAMNGETPAFVMKPVPYFNGSLFADSAPGAGDGKEVLDLTQIPGAIDLLEEVSNADWRFVNPTIFGTLFEGALDPAKRSQLGAHYTGEADIRLVIEPVLMQPLYRQWEAAQAEAEPLMQTYLTSDAPRAKQEARDRLIQLHDTMMTAIGSTTVLDPACGSGNFLYLSLRALKDLEGRVRRFFEPLGLPFRDVVTPRQLYGIEKDLFASKLAHVVVWIGYLQWRYEDEGILHPYLPRLSVPHDRTLPNPIIQDKLHPDEPDRIINDDAILRYDAEGKPYEPDWQPVDVIVGNPPFLGRNFLRGELGVTYTRDLFAMYGTRIPSQSNLVCYWYEKARDQIGKQKLKRAGLLATSSIRQTTSRPVLERIKSTGDIFMAWSDREWTLDGAQLRISIVGFDDGSETEKVLDGVPVASINSDLTGQLDVTSVVQLSENANLSFMADTKGGKFEIDAETAQRMISAKNPTGVSNADVVRPWIIALDIVRRPRNMWIIDFGVDMPLEKAEQYELPFQHIKSKVSTKSDKWWIHERPRPNMRQAIAPLSRFIVTPLVSKHRIFVWVESGVPDVRLTVIARADDYFFGVLHSAIHELWSLRQAGSHGVGNDPVYNKATTFDTFPFPYPPGTEPLDAPIYAAISAAAKALHEEREAWLNPPELLALDKTGTSAEFRDRTLTNLYNALVAYRGGDAGERLTAAARAFAPRLAELHDALDRAVLEAYGWSDLADRLRTPDGDEELLRRLLALNLERAASPPTP